MVQLVHAEQIDDRRQVTLALGRGHVATDVVGIDADLTRYTESLASFLDGRTALGGLHGAGQLAERIGAPLLLVALDGRQALAVACRGLRLASGRELAQLVCDVQPGNHEQGDTERG
ncbi:MAG: hypothetical protein AB7S36_16495, partial [Planctomycetota bacterium]